MASDTILEINLPPSELAINCPGKLAEPIKLPDNSLPGKTDQLEQIPFSVDMETQSQKINPFDNIYLRR